MTSPATPAVITYVTTDDFNDAVQQLKMKFDDLDQKFAVTGSTFGEIQKAWQVKNDEMNEAAQRIMAIENTFENQLKGLPAELANVQSLMMSLQNKITSLESGNIPASTSGMGSAKEAEFEKKIHNLEKNMINLQVKIDSYENKAGNEPGGQRKTSLYDLKKMDPGKFADSEDLVFQAWRDDMELIVGKTDKDFKQILHETRKSTTELKEAEIKSKFPEFDWCKVKELHTYLELKTAGEARQIVKNHGGEDENGLEAWRALHDRYEPRTITTDTAMMTKVFETVKREVKDVKEVPAVISELEDRARKYNTTSRSGIFPVESLKGLLMTVLPTEAKTFMSQHSGLPWIEYRAKVLEFVYHATAGAAPMIHAVDEGCGVHHEEEWGAEYGINGVFQKGKGGKASGGKGFPGQCFICKGYGHKAADCPHNTKGKGK